MLQKRPPIIVVLGSIDHGKTTLLDYIRKTNVAAKEPGGITQSIGAYEIMHQCTSASSLRESAPSEGRKITFIDTPGHEAFSKMRSRGAKIADIAILVVAADDSVKPQTKESIKIIQEAKIPFVVAINKIDKQPDISKVKNDLMQAGVLLEGYGGNISYQPISAKTGQGVNELLDLILLAAEMENFQYDPDKKGEGFIIESKLDSRRGIIATAIIKNGTIKLGEGISMAEAGGKIKSLENFQGKKIDKAEASSPVLITGFTSLPKAGEEFFVGETPKKEITVLKAESKPLVIPEEKDEKTINLIIKGDVSGSMEALSEIIKNLPAKDRAIKIIEESIGDISDGDVKLAISTNAAIIGFKVKTTKAAQILAQEHRILIIQSDIIYELIKFLEEKLLSAGKISGEIEVLAVFGKKNKKQIIGGRVKIGKIKIGTAAEIKRNQKDIGKGKILNLQQNKKDVKEVEVGIECGILFESDVEIKKGDILKIY